ncbi:MAG: hypothetical protein IJY69_02765 [Clostridia bacterium]|nr:hypothetical protein [Clostridia bacterium]
MKTTKRKFSLGVKIASILSCVAVLSVGFASWLIVNVPTETNDTIGSFEVYEVVDNSVTLSYDWGADGAADKDGEGNYTDDATTAAKIIFGKPASGSATNSWLTAGADVQNEQLVSKVKVTVGNYANLTDFTVTLAAPTAYTDLGNKVATPAVRYLNAAGTADADTDGDGKLSKTELDADGVKGTVVVELVFGWGAYFTQGGDIVNPFFFYNNQTYSAALAADASATLGAIRTALNGQTYSVTFACN